MNIDYNKTTAAFRSLGYTQFDELFSQYKVSPLFESLETGKIPENDFLQEMSRLTTLPVTNNAIINASNAMMLDFRAGCLEFLEELSANYNLYLLSNNNVIHLKRFREIFTRDTGKSTLDIYFRKLWYSHEVGLRKPNIEIYEFVLQDGNLMASETLFIDDTATNVEAARQLGINGHILKPTERIEQLGL